MWRISPPTKIQSFQITLFNLSRTWEILDAGNCSTGNFSLNATLLLVLRFWKGIYVTDDNKILKFEENWGQFEQKFVVANNLRKKNMEQSKSGQEQKNVIITSA